MILKTVNLLVLWWERVKMNLFLIPARKLMRVCSSLQWQDAAKGKYPGRESRRYTNTLHPWQESGQPCIHCLEMLSHGILDSIQTTLNSLWLWTPSPLVPTEDGKPQKQIKKKKKTQLYCKIAAHCSFYRMRGNGAFVGCGWLVAQSPNKFWCNIID